MIYTISQMYCPKCKQVVNGLMRNGKVVNNELPIEFYCEKCKMTLQVIYPSDIKPVMGDKE